MNLLVLTQFINPFSTNGFDIFKEYRSRTLVQNGLKYYLRELLGSTRISLGKKKQSCKTWRPKTGQAHVKSFAMHAARFLTCVWRYCGY